VKRYVAMHTWFFCPSLARREGEGGKLEGRFDDDENVEDLKNYLDG
jgi:hypothetical protein